MKQGEQEEDSVAEVAYAAREGCDDVGGRCCCFFKGERGNVRRCNGERVSAIGQRVLRGGGAARDEGSEALRQEEPRLSRESDTGRVLIR